MPLFDFSVEELESYKPVCTEPAGFDEFWQNTIEKTVAHELRPLFTPYKTDLTLVDVHDVTFNGYAGEQVRAWFIVPRHVSEPCTTVVKYRGYGDGRGAPHEWLLWPAAGIPILVMDTRGQAGSVTADPDPRGEPQSPGFVTRGVASPETYYYRRLFMDAYRAVDAAASHPAVDPARIVVMGSSQGGAVTQAVAGLRGDLLGALIDVPFLTDITRAMDVADGGPYGEIVDYLARNRDNVDLVFGTLAYFDGVHFAARATARARYSVGLADKVCPPSTAFAAYNHYGGAAEMDVWRFNGHEGGGVRQQLIQLRWILEL